MITIRPVHDFKDFHENYLSDIENHISDCEPARTQDFGIDVDTDSFQQLIDIGVLGWFIFFDEEETFVGYAGIIMTPCLIHKGRESANIEYLYIHPDCREKGYSKEVFGVLEELLAEENVSVINLILPNKTYSDVFADKTGYIKTSSTYYKKIEEVSN